MNSINEFNNTKEVIAHHKTPLFSNFIIIVSYFFILIFICMFIKYPKNYLTVGLVNEDIITMYLDSNTLAHLNNIFIENNKVDYKIVNKSFNDNYYVIDISIDKKVSKDIVDIVINDGESNLYNDFIKKIWKGFETWQI